MENVVFTCHAFKRMGERVSIRAEIISEILRRDCGFEIGKEEESSRIHYLFYSPRDYKCFVSIIAPEEKDNVVITVLPQEYENKIEITHELKTLAKTKTSSITTIIDELFPAKETLPTTFRISAYIRQDNGRILTKEIGKIPAIEYENKIESLLNSNFSEILLDMIRIKGIPLQNICSVFLKLGSGNNKPALTLKEW